MKRKIFERLLSWKNNNKRNRKRMPLVINGARQVGKTYIIKEFAAKEYKNSVYVNLETNLAVSSFFEDNINPRKIISFLETLFDQEIVPDETLIIFDEIQTCERALTSLKYFNEEAFEYHIIVAGSLLGVAINREKYSFPVGNVETITMYPLSFEEFLMALDKNRLIQEIQTCFNELRPMPLALHQNAMELYKLYIIIGGMPACIKEYVETHKFINIPEIQNNILNDYIADMSKYASNSESVKIRAAYQSIPNQLAKNNKKFQYKVVQKGGNANMFGNAIDWLSFAGIVLKCQKIEQGIMPIAVYSDLSSFKLYMGDVGLLTMKSGIAHQTILSSLEIDNTFLGAIAENYVAQSLVAQNHPLYYWESSGIAEIDFVIQQEDRVIPIEVKAGKRVKSKSLFYFREKYSTNESIRISAKNFGFENSIKSIPLYSVFCIK